MRRQKRSAQLDREIAAALSRSPGRRGSRVARHYATIATAAPHVAAITEAIYRTKDPTALVAAVKAANQHVANMKRVARRHFVARAPEYKDRPGIRGSALVDSAGEYDPAMYELTNLLVEAKKRVKNIKKRSR